MRYKIASLAAAAIAFGGVQVASAADMAVKAPIMRAPLVASYNWTGCYIGVKARISSATPSPRIRSTAPIGPTISISTVLSAAVLSDVTIR